MIRYATSSVPLNRAPVRRFPRSVFQVSSAFPQPNKVQSIHKEAVAEVQGRPSTAISGDVAAAFFSQVRVDGLRVGGATRLRSSVASPTEISRYKHGSVQNAALCPYHALIEQRWAVKNLLLWRVYFTFELCHFCSSLRSVGYDCLVFPGTPSTLRGWKPRLATRRGVDSTLLHATELASVVASFGSATCPAARFASTWASQSGKRRDGNRAPIWFPNLASTWTSQGGKPQYAKPMHYRIPADNTGRSNPAS